MKIKNNLMVALWTLAVFIYCVTQTNSASAYDVKVINTTNAKVNVVLIALSSWVFGGQNYSKRYYTDPLPANGGSYTFQVPVSSENLCPGYLDGWDANWNAFPSMGCNGVENNLTTMTCSNLVFEVYKKNDNTLHFRIK